MALSDYWSLLCPLAIEEGFNIALFPSMTENPRYLTLYREDDDPVMFEPVFNQPDDFGEPAPQIGIRLWNPNSTHQDYLRYILTNFSIEKAAEKTWLETSEGFRGYIWKPIPYDPETADWQAIPKAVMESWTSWHIDNLKKAKALFFHEKV